MANCNGRPNGYPDTQELVQVQFDDPAVQPYQPIPSAHYADGPKHPELEAQLAEVWKKLGTPLPDSSQYPRLLEPKDLSDGRPGDDDYHPHVSLPRY